MTNVQDYRTRMRYCGLTPEPPPIMPAGLDSGRVRALIAGDARWVNGTVLHYFFFDQQTDTSLVKLPDGTVEDASWVGAPDQEEAVRRAFQSWRELGIGLEFREVSDRSEAEIRIGFQRGAGSWSRVGRDVLGVGINNRTTNFGWDLTGTDGQATALHEIGHLLGLKHEHQSPYTGIVWDEPRVYEFFAGPPNFWARERTFYNVIRQLSMLEVEGSTWDADSIMQYPFPPGLILQPEEYADGVSPPGTVSEADAEFVRRWYPPTDPAQRPTLLPFQSQALDLAAGEQADYNLAPPASRSYQIAVFGAADVVLVLFEEVGGELRYVSGDDDGGEGRNARIAVKLFEGRKYVVRARLNHVWASGRIAIMYW